MTEAVDVFDHPLLASVYDDLNPWGAWDDFYLGLARESGHGVLDLGCGTGRLACRVAAEAIEVVGVEPAAGMLGRARARPGGEAVTWLRSDGRRLESTLPCGPTPYSTGPTWIAVRCSLLSIYMWPRAPHYRITMRRRGVLPPNPWFSSPWICELTIIGRRQKWR